MIDSMLFRRAVCAVAAALLLVSPISPVARRVDAAGEVRALWVVRTTLVSPAAVRTMVESARAAGFNTLLVQVRGRGDAYFQHGVEPIAPPLVGQGDFDPLATAVQLGHAAGLQVHAWINVNLVAGDGALPAAPDHVVYRHPEWLMVPEALAADLGTLDVRSPAYLGRLARYARSHSSTIEGLYLSPVTAGARDYTAAVVRDIVERYPVDGVHFDYLRYPNDSFDYGRDALDAFRAEVAGPLPPEARQRYDAQLDADPLAYTRAFPQRWRAFRSARLTDLLVELKDTVKAVRPSALVSVAVAPDPDRGGPAPAAGLERLAGPRSRRRRLPDGVYDRRGDVRRPGAHGARRGGQPRLGGHRRLPPLGRSGAGQRGDGERAWSGRHRVLLLRQPDRSVARTRVSRRARPRRVHEPVSAGAVDAARRIVEEAVASRVFPGAAIEVGAGGGPLWREAIGTLAFDAASAVTADTPYDLASLTKPLATTTAALALAACGALDLESPVAAHVADWRGADRADVTIRDLLEHAGGLPARLLDAPPEGRRAFEHDIASTPLEYPPRSASIYSDLGFILLGFILEDRGRAPLARQFQSARDQLTGGEPALGDGVLAFAELPDRIGGAAPTRPLNDDRRRGRRLVGEVHDNYAAALGGVAGHSGLFGTAASVGSFARLVLRAARGDRPTAPPLTESAVRLAITRSSVAGSSRALGWDRMRPTSSCGTRMSTDAFGHVGFTGTSLWIDPARDRYFVLLANRVCDGGSSEAMQVVRRAFHDALAEV